MQSEQYAHICFAADVERAWAQMSDETFRNEFDLLVAAHRAVTARLITALVHARRRRFWHRDGLPTAADWAARELGTTKAHATRLVAVGAACERLPELADAVERGDISDDQAGLLARHATPASVDDMLNAAKKADTYAGLINHVAAVAAADPIRRQDAPDYGASDGDTSGDPHRALQPPPPHHRPSEVTANAELDGRIVVTADFTPDDGDIFLTQLHRATERASFSGGAAVPWRNRMATTLLELVGGANPPTAELVVHVFDQGDEQDPFSQTSHGKPLALAAMRRLGCNAIWRPIVYGPNGTVGIGRRSRSVPAHLDRFVRARDDCRCRFPGCSSTNWTHLHHLVPWEAGGATDADNLIVLCSRHHALAHEGGWEFRGTADALEICRPNGTPLHDVPLPAPAAARPGPVARYTHARVASREPAATSDSGHHSAHNARPAGERSPAGGVPPPKRLEVRHSPDHNSAGRQLDHDKPP